MRRALCTIIAALTSLFFIGMEVRAQRDLPRFEIGGQFSLLSLNSPSSQNSIGLGAYYDNPCKQFDLVCRRVEVGGGARVTYNLTNHIALEAEGNFFPELGAVCALCCPCPAQVFERPAETRHNLQFSAGIGIRF